MIKLTYKLSRKARIGVILVVSLLVATLYTTFLTNYFLTDVIAGYAQQNAALKQALWDLANECKGVEGYEHGSAIERYQHKSAIHRL